MPETALDKEENTLRFSYAPWKVLSQLGVFGFGAGLVLVAALRDESRGSVGAAVLLIAVALWGLLYVRRRLKNPKTFLVNAATVRAYYWIGPEQSWRIDALTIETSSLPTIWEGSLVARVRESGVEAFRAYRDLPGFKELCLALQRDRSSS